MNNQVTVAQLAEQQDFNPDDFGSRPNSGSTCWWCSGTGEMRTGSADKSHRIECAHCKGTGKMIIDPQPTPPEEKTMN